MAKLGEPSAILVACLAVFPPALTPRPLPPTTRMPAWSLPGNHRPQYDDKLVALVGEVQN